MDPQAGPEGARVASHWPRALALLGGVALVGLVVRMLAQRSDDDLSLIVEGPQLPADSVQVERHALRSRQELAVPASRRPVWSQPDADVSARVPEPVLIPAALARPRPAPPPLVEVPAPPPADEVPAPPPPADEVPTPSPPADEVPAPPPPADEVPAPPPPLDEVPAPPPAADEPVPTTDAGTTSATAAKAAAPPPPPPLRGTNNAPIFD